MRTLGQAKDDLGFGGAAQQPVGARIGRRRMPGHREAPGRGGKRLGLGMDRTARSPPPGAVHKRPVRRVHQPDDGMVDRRGEAHAFDEPRRCVLEPVEIGDAGRGRRVVAKVHPDVARAPPHRIDADPDAAGREGLARHQRRDRGAVPAGVEAPAVIAALDLPPVETAGGERHAAMRADVAQCERHASGVAADQHRLAQHDFCQHRPRFQARAGDREIPRLAQRRGVVLHPASRRYLLPAGPHRR